VPGADEFARIPAKVCQTAGMVDVQGTCHPRFAEVRREAERNFAERGEVGASVCVTVDGERVVDLWGGSVAGSSEGGPARWEADTLVVVFSCTKGMTALCAHVLVGRGLLDVEAPVAEYWPEFARAGKEATTVRMLLDHSAGVPTWREKLPDGAAHDFDEMAHRLEQEAPFWEPGTRSGYHMLSFGWTVGEVVRRVSGRSLGTFLREEVAGPAGADVWIGLPDSEERRVSRVIPFAPDPAQPSRFTQALRADRSSIQALALLNGGGFNPNSRASRAAEVGAAGGLASARGLAAMYQPLALGGGDLVDPDTLARMAQVATATDRDATLLIGTRFSLGFMTSIDNRRRVDSDHDSAVLSSTAFGHVGAGGSIGFADPACRMSFGYVMNRQGPGILLNERGQSLVDATYRALGYASNASGAWVR
jgi:CubicO group peptidase (beta-lactamase class C family)